MIQTSTLLMKNDGWKQHLDGDGVTARRYPRSVSVVIPAYNERENIASVLEEILSRLRLIEEVEWEVIVIDDGSQDGMAEVIAEFEEVKLLRHPYNCGYGASLKSGILAAKGEVVVAMDADGQHNPDDLTRLLDNMGEYAMSCGSRVASSGVPRLRRPGKWILSRMMNYLARRRIPDINCGYRALRRDIISRYLHLCSDRYSFSMSSTLALLSEGHFIRFIDIKCRSRQGAESQVKFSSGFDAFLTLLRSTIVFHPFRVFMPISSAFAVVGTGSLVYDLCTFNISDTTVLLLVSTLFIFLFGLVSDQIARVRRELH